MPNMYLNQNTLKIEETGTVEFQGDGRVWDDLQVAVSNARLPASSAPTWTTYDFGIGSGIAFNVLGFGVGEYYDFYLQTSHSMQLNTVLDNHIHWTIPTNSASDQFQFQLDVIAASIGSAFAVPTGSPFTVEKTLSGAEAGKHNYLELADIPAANTTVSSIYICRLTRIAATANEYGSDVYILFNDSHYIKDTVGSRTETAK